LEQASDYKFSSSELLRASRRRKPSERALRIERTAWRVDTALAGSGIRHNQPINQ